MKPIQFKTPIVFSDRADAPAGARPSDKAQRGDAQAPASHDTPTVPVESDIEDHDRRLPFQRGEGFLQISVKPGSSRFGEIQLEVQFEGEIGQPEQCGAEHSRHFLEELKRLETILSEIVDDGVQLECQIAALPCPKVPVRLNLDHLLKVEPGTVTISETLSLGRSNK